jgi:magnesium transporter
MARPAESKPSKVVNRSFKTLSRDVLSLSDHATFLTTNINFLLDATLGLINIEQTGIIKIFSVAATVFLPPTLIASIYGMNFEHMPELALKFGYPLSIGLMILSAVLPYYFFKRKGWL